jgi:hypothetical protein
MNETVEQWIWKKEVLKSRIMEAIVDFEEQTGLSVNGIDILPEFNLVGFKTADINIEVKLP